MQLKDILNEKWEAMFKGRGSDYKSDDDIKYPMKSN